MCPHHVCRDACAIADGDTVVLTGGQNTMRTVSRYGTGGWLEDLPRMNLGRADHGCASFVQEGDKVSAAPPHRLSCAAQVFIVSGVFGASSEVLRAGAWTLVAPLPAPVTGVRGAALANTVYMMGNCSAARSLTTAARRWPARQQELLRQHLALQRGHRGLGGGRHHARAQGLPRSQPRAARGGRTVLPLIQLPVMAEAWLSAAIKMKTDTNDMHLMLSVNFAQSQFKSTLSEFSSAGAQTEAAPHEGPPVGEVPGLAVVARHPRTRGLGAQAQQPQLLGPGLLQAAPQVGHGLGHGNMVTPCNNVIMPYSHLLLP